jgi:hypothetical protein
MMLQFLLPVLFLLPPTEDIRTQAIQKWRAKYEATTTDTTPQARVKRAKLKSNPFACTLSITDHSAVGAVGHIAYPVRVIAKQADGVLVEMHYTTGAARGGRLATAQQVARFLVVDSAIKSGVGSTGRLTGYYYVGGIRQDRSRGQEIRVLYRLLPRAGELPRGVRTPTQK